MIRLCTLGEAAIEVGKRRYGTEADLVFATTLYLASQHGRRVPRPTLLELFWPRVADESRRHNLRQLVYKLRRIGVPCQSDTTHVSLRADDVVADYDTYFSPRVAEGEVVRPDAPFGEFLAGYAPRISPAFAEWVENRRAEVHGQMRRVLLASLSASKQRGEWLEVDRLARRVIQIDTLNEEATLALAEATAMSGSKVAAVAMLDRYVEELGPGATEIRLPATVLRKRMSQNLSGIPENAESPLVGRAEILANVANRLHGLKNTQGGGIWLEGEAGIGKSRLLVAIQATAELQGFLTCIVRGDSMGTRPLGLMGALAMQLVDIPGALGASPAAYGALKKFFAGDSILPAGARVSSRETEALLSEAVVDVLFAVSAERPLVVTIDDLDHSDASSRRILEEVSTRMRDSKVMIVASARSFDSAQPLRASQYSLKLRPLSDSDAEQLLRFIDPTLPHPARARCVTLGAGNPLFLRELANHWRNQGEVSQLPDSLSRALSQRLSQLGEGPLQTLQAIAMLGRHASHETLNETLETNASVMLANIAALESANLLSQATLEVKHPTIAEFARAQLHGHSSRFLHRRVAIVLDRRHQATNDPTILADCLEHWHRTGDGERIAAAALVHAMSLLDSGLPEEAVACLKEATSASVSAKTKRKVLSQLLETHALASQWTSALETCRAISALDKAAQHAPIHSMAELVEVEAQWHLDGEPAKALARVRKCVTDELATTEHRLHAVALAIAFADNAGDSEARSLLHSLGQRLVPTTNKERALQLQAEVVYYTSAGDSLQAANSATALVEVSRGIAEHSVRLRSLRHASRAFTAVGDLETGRTLLLQAANDALSHGLCDLAALAYRHLATVALNSGDLAQAEEYCAKGAQFEDSTSDQLAINYSRDMGGRLALLRGDPGAALEMIPDKPAILRMATLRDKSALLGVWLRAKMMQDARFVPEEEDAKILERALREGTDSVSADDTVYTLYLTLRRLGKSDAASQRLATYINEQRRTAAPLSSELREALDDDPAVECPKASHRVMTT